MKASPPSTKATIDLHLLLCVSKLQLRKADSDIILAKLDTITTCIYNDAKCVDRYMISKSDWCCHFPAVVTNR